MCCLIYKVLCRCLIGRNFIISHCLHFVKHFLGVFQTLFHACRRFDSLIIIPHSEALVNIFFQYLFKPLSRFGIFCILSHPSLPVKNFFFLLTFCSLHDSLSILPHRRALCQYFFPYFFAFFTILLLSAPFYPL